MPRCRSRIKGAWLVKVGDVTVDTIEEVTAALTSYCSDSNTDTQQCFLTFSHPAIRHGLTNDGIPQINLDQLNPRLTFDDEEFSVPNISALKANRVMKHWDNGVL